MEGMTGQDPQKEESPPSGEGTTVEVKTVENENGQYQYLHGIEVQGVPEKFLNPDHGVNLSSLVEGYNKLEKSRGDLRSTLEAELTEQLAPKAPDEYALPSVDSSSLPEGLEITLEGNPDVEMFTDLAKSAGLTQEQFDSVIAGHVQRESDRFKQTAANVKEILGDNAGERITKVIGTLKANLPEGEYNALNETVTTPQGILALEKVLSAQWGVGAGDGGTGGDEIKTEAEIKEMMKDERYSGLPHQRDEGYIKQVRAHWKRLYPQEGVQGYSGNQNIVTG